MIHEHFAEYHRAVCASPKTWTLASLSLSHILGKPSYATNRETSREKNCVCAIISNNHGTLWWNYWQLENLLQPDITGWKSLCLCNSDTTMELIDRVNTTFEGQLENDDLAMDYWQCCRTLGEILKNLNLGPLRQVNCSAEVVFQRYRSWNWFSELVKGLEASLRVMLIGASPNPNISNDSRGNPFPAKAFLFYRARIQFMSKNRRVVCATSDVLAKSSWMPHITGSAKSEQLAGEALIGRRVPPELLHRPPLASRSRGSQREAWQAGLAWQAEVGGILCLCACAGIPAACEAKPPCAAQGPVCLWASGNRSNELSLGWNSQRKCR